MLTVIDSIIIILLIMGAVIGFKKGLIKSAVSFFGTLLVIALSFALKNPVSEFLYMHLPFFDFSGALAGVTVINILVYEVVAFIIVFGILEFLLKIVVFASGIVEKLLNLTVVLGLFSKILGLIFGFIEYYLIIFVALFLLNNVSYINPYIKESSFAKKILNSTPLVTDTIKEQTKAIDEIVALQDTYKEDKEAYNKNAFEILIKYDVISPSSANKLISENKLSITDAQVIIDKYSKEK